MNTFKLTSSLALLIALAASVAAAQQEPKLGENAALRYWAAFSQMQDSAITDQQATELNLILDGTAPYDDVKYKDLLEKNRSAFETMASGTSFPNCDWGIDYKRADIENEPVDYARKALALGRLNVLYVFHLLVTGDKEGAVRTAASGLRFSRDVANGGTLFATLVAKDVLTTHFRAIAFALHMGGISPAQRLLLQRAVAQLGPTGLDWQSATRRDLEGLRGRFSQDSQASAALTRITSSYVGTLKDTGKLPALQQALASAPQHLSDVIPNPRRLLEQKQEFSVKLQQIRSLLQ